MHPHIFQQSWRYIDHTEASFSPLLSFAYDDTFCTSIGEHESIPVIRSWVHPPTVVLGIQDSRLPFIERGISFLHKAGFNVIVRNSGGLAVILDQGILNISLIIKEQKMFSIEDGYELMYHLLRTCINEKPVIAKEIVGSYCPGSYDLSINGKKFAGISQRRMRGGAAVQIYLCANGSGAARATILRQFYQLAASDIEPTFACPNILPDTMASLSELLLTKMDVDYLMNRILYTMSEMGSEVVPSVLTDDELQLFQHFSDRIIKRNDKALENNEKLQSEKQE